MIYLSGCTTGLSTLPVYVAGGNLTLLNTTNFINVTEWNATAISDLNMQQYSLINASWINSSNVNVTGSIFAGKISVGLTESNYLLELGNASKVMNISNILFVNGTSGSVGIGTNNPSDLSGGILAIRTQGTTANVDSMSLYANSSGSSLYILQGNDNGYGIYVQGNKNFISGKLSVGGIDYANSRPVQSLDVYGNINVTSNIYAYNSTSWINATNFNATTICLGGSCKTIWPVGNISGTGTIGYVPLWQNSSVLNNSGIVMSQGNIGINTTAPKALFEISGGNAANNIFRISRSGGLVGNLTIDMGSGNVNFVATNDYVFWDSSELISLLKIKQAGDIFLKSFLNATIINSTKVYANFIGINTTNPQYPLDVESNGTAGISIYASGNISATGYITRTNVFTGNALSQLKPSSAYLNPDGSVNHDAFGYSEVKYQKQVIDYYKKGIVTELICDENVKSCKYVDKEIMIPVYKTVAESGIDLAKEVALLKQAIYELNQKAINCGC
jgi:hypothetical protein